MSLRYAVGPSGKCTKVIASSRLAIRWCDSGGGDRAEVRTGLLHVFVYDHKVGEPSPRRPPRDLPHLKPPRLRPSVELCPGEDPDEFIAKLIRRARRLGRRRDEHFGRDRRVVGGGKVGGERVGRYVCRGLGGRLLLYSCGGGRGRVVMGGAGGRRVGRQERRIKLARIFKRARDILRQSFLCFFLIYYVVSGVKKGRTL